MTANHGFATPLGAMEAVVGPAGELVRLEFSGEIGSTVPTAGTTAAAAGAAPVARQIGEYFAGERRAFELALDLEGTGFERAVWEALLDVSWGETISYGALAERIGERHAARAVGRAVGANPIAIVIPCHRALGARGALTGYAGGIERKRALLELEGSLTADLFP